jgi:hypothetical protein
MKGGRVELMLRNQVAWAAAAVFLGLVAIYALVSLAYLTPEVFWSPDSGMKHLQAANMRWEGGPAFSIFYPGKAIDPDLQYVPFGITFYAENAGNIYSIWPVVFPLISKPFLELAGYQGLLIVPIVSGALTSLIGFWLLSGHSIRLRLLAAFLTGLGTPIFIYSLLYWEHIVYTFLVFLATGVLITQIEKVVPHYKLLFLAGLLFAIAIYFRPEGFLFVLAIAGAWLLTFKEPRQLKGMALAGAAFFSSLAIYFLIDRFVPIATRDHVQGFTVPGGSNLEYLDSQGLRAISNFLVGTDISGILSLLFVASLATALAIHFTNQQGPISRAAFLLSLAGLLIASTLILAASQDFQIFNGLLSASPVLVFGLLMLRAPSCRRPTFLGLTALLYFLLAAMSLAFLAYGSATNTIGGLEWGPRFFLPFYPLMAVVSVYYLGQLLKEPSGPFKAACLTLFVSLLIVGIAVQSTGVQRIHADNQSAQSVREIFATLPGDTVVATDEWWLSTGPLAFDFEDRVLFLTYHPDQLPGLVARFEEQGISRFWLASFTPPENHEGLQMVANQGFLWQVGQRRYARNGLCFCEILLQRNPAAGPPVASATWFWQTGHRPPATSPLGDSQLPFHKEGAGTAPAGGGRVIPVIIKAFGVAQEGSPVPTIAPLNRSCISAGLWDTRGMPGTGAMSTLATIRYGPAPWRQPSRALARPAGSDTRLTAGYPQLRPTAARSTFALMEGWPPVDS